MKRSALLMTFMVLLPSLSKADGLWTDSENGVIYNYKDDGTASVSRSKGASGDLVIRDSIKVGEKYYHVTAIDPGSFYFNSAVTSVTIPNSVEKIGYSAFEGCKKLASASLGGGVKIIESSTFCESGLESISIPSQVKKIYPYAFAFCNNLRRVIIEDSDELLSTCNGWVDEFSVINECPPFMFSNIEYLYIGRNFDSSLGYADNQDSPFYYLSELTTVVLGDKVTWLPSGAFSECSKLNNINLPDSLTYLGSSAFYGCSSLTSITIPESIKKINSYVFADCFGLTEINIPEGVTEINNNAFYGCSSLTSASIPSSVTTFGEKLFASCSKLDSITCFILKPFDIKNNCFDSQTYSKATLHVPLISIDLYKSTEGWKKFKNITQIKNNQKTVSITVTDDIGNDVTEKVYIQWQDADGNVIGQGSSLGNIDKNADAFFSILLEEDLGITFREIHHMKAETNEKGTMACQLQRIERIGVSGKVHADDGPLPMAHINITQWLNGKYMRTTNVRTNNGGFFNTQAFADSTKIVVSAEGFTDFRQSYQRLMEGDPGNIRLKAFDGKVVRVSLTFRPSAKQGVVTTEQPWYPNMNDIGYSVRNMTKNTELSNFIVQGDALGIPEGIDDGDCLSITARSMGGNFADASAECVVTARDTIDVTLHLAERGSVELYCPTRDDEQILALLFDSGGSVATWSAFSSQRMTLRGMEAGRYRLAVMGYHTNAAAIGSMESLDALGLTEGLDYVLRDTDIRDGVICEVTVDQVPEADPEKFGMTGGNTSFLLNKTRLNVGAYVTPAAIVDFKPQYKDNISDIVLCIEVPEGCVFIDNSVVVDNVTSRYSLSGSTLRIPLTMEQLGKRVRCCIASILPGTFECPATVSFNCHGGKSQTVGTAVFEVTGNALLAPTVTNDKSIYVSGIVLPGAEVDIYDNNSYIGTTKAQKDGYWTAKVGLSQPYNLSSHDITARIQAFNVTGHTEKRTCLYDINQVMVKTVTMSFYNDFLGKQQYVTFDFERNTTSSNSYSFATFSGQGSNFTFVADLTENDSTKVKEVTFHVSTSNWMTRKLQGFYDGKLDRWVASGFFDVSGLPVSLAVDVRSADMPKIDKQQTMDVMLAMTDVYDQYKTLKDKIDLILSEDEEYEEMASRLSEIGFEEDELETADIQREISAMTDKEIDEWLAKNDIDDYEAATLSLEASTDSIGNMLRYDSHFSYEMEDGSSCSVSDCSGIDEATLIQQGFERIEATDSTFCYLLIAENKSEYIDFDNNIRITVSHPNLQFASYANSLSTSGLDEFNRIIDEINSCYGRIRDLYKDLAETFDWTLKNFEKMARSSKKSLSQANTRYIMKMGKLENLQNEVGKLNPGDPAYLIKKAELEATAKEVKSAKKLLFAAKRNKLLAHAAAKMAKPLGGIFQKTIPFAKYGEYVYEILKLINNYKQIYETIPDPCTEDEQEADKLRGNCITRATVSGTTLVTKLGVDAALDFAVATQILSSPATGGTSALTAVLTILGKSAACLVFDMAYEKADELYRDDLLKMIKQLKCYDENDPQQGGMESDMGLDNYMGDQNNNPTSALRPVTPIIDPSGYVYEAVPSNRVEGVTATIYYNDNGPHKWDAKEYSQENPIVTDRAGLYAWDVPQGSWKVRFEKEGYEPTETEWLPVPPPQLEVNIPMVHAVSPKVSKVRGTESGIRLEFDKYMKPESLTKSGRVTVKRNGKNVSGKVVMLNQEEDPLTEKTYASQAKFVPNTAFNAKEKVTVTVKKEVESYAFMNMKDDFVATLTIEPEINDIKTDSLLVVDYKESKDVVVSVEPASASHGRLASIISSSPMIASVSQETVTLDNEGKAVVSLTGNLPGNTSLVITLPGTELMAKPQVNVTMHERTVKAPKASKRSGFVEKGFLLTLSSATPGATIWYTTDGTCPCDSKKCTRYEKPIMLTDDVTIKAMAKREGMEDSKVSTYTYIIDDGEGIAQTAANTPAIRYESGMVIIDDAAGGTCTIYDMLGREVVNRHITTAHDRIIVPTTGIYIVSVVRKDMRTFVWKVNTRW